MNDDLTDDENEEIAKWLVEADADPARAEEAKAIREEYTLLALKKIGVHNKIIRGAIASSERITSHFKQYLQHGRPKATWERFDGARLKELREGLLHGKRSQRAFCRNCGVVKKDGTPVSDDTLQRWERNGRARRVDFEKIVSYLKSEYPALDIESFLSRI
jgi:hypothetical protein